VCRLRLDPETLKRANPRCIGLQVTAFRGERRGPQDNDVGFDPSIQGPTGIMERFAVAAGRLKTGQYLRPHAADRGLARNAERPEVGDTSHGGLAGERRQYAAALRGIVCVLGCAGILWCPFSSNRENALVIWNPKDGRIGPACREAPRAHFNAAAFRIRPPAVHGCANCAGRTAPAGDRRDHRGLERL